MRELFEHLNAGKHLNRMTQQRLWAELEREQGQYETLFAALGYALRIDGRGFAWFHSDEGTSNVTKTTRQLALLFMLIFEFKADMGVHLARFTEWPIDQGLLLALIEKNNLLLKAEHLAEVDQLTQLMRTAANYGFAIADGAGWRLLPAVFRYLDRFEELAHRDATGEADASDAELGDDIAVEEDDA
ncbi:hypothetical protein [Azoarcus sp. CIB]|uniref:condensin complex protein MksE n=1 Tax=Aromatoleum sp. (strain CIB) TaxID=198107 RepID=UPI0018DC1299|nr:hypothetical protein [Azoarcus sp. CIB]